ncbi:MAG: hypothetical protein JWN48_923, partial [Myxococcaceae bacterium]|nr:hypothetical protein [Myxococcaceae bacterium]
ATEARLDHLVPRLSTRMGAALRHATHWLSSTVAERRLLLLLTDGEPADVDAPDPNYLLHDARQAVFEGRRRDLSVLAVSLDASGAPYLRRIFGAGRYLVLPSLPQLPRVLADVYARLHV